MNKIKQIAEKTATHIGNISQGCIETLIKETREAQRAEIIREILRKLNDISAPKTLEEIKGIIKQLLK